MRREYLEYGLEWLEHNPGRWTKGRLIAENDGALCFCAWGIAAAIEAGWDESMDYEQTHAILDTRSLISNPSYKSVAVLNDAASSAEEAILLVLEILDTLDLENT